MTLRTHFHYRNKNEGVFTWALNQLIQRRLWLPSIAGSLFQKSLTDLIKRDLVFQNKRGEYRVMDHPAIAHFLRQKSKVIA